MEWFRKPDRVIVPIMILWALIALWCLRSISTPDVLKNQYLSRMCLLCCQYSRVHDSGAVWILVRAPHEYSWCTSKGLVVVWYWLTRDSIEEDYSLLQWYWLLFARSRCRHCKATSLADSLNGWKSIHGALYKPYFPVMLHYESAWIRRGLT